MEELVTLPLKTVNEILSIFGNMTYNQVAQIVAKIQQEAKPVDVAPTDKEPATTI